MGICSSQGASSANKKSVDKFGIVAMQESLQNDVKISLEVQVAHFTPSSFPLLPIVTSKSSRLCEDSWNKIINNDVVDEYGGKSTGMTAFYSEFYERLEQFDSSGKFEAVLSRNTSGENKIAAKGAILIRIIKFILKIEGDTKEVQLLLYMLGKSHSQKQIRPWQYTTFVQTLLNTIASRLGTEATNDVMEAWVHLFAFVMKSMLPPAIQGQVVETELNINTSSEFESGKLADEVAEIEETRQVRKNMKKRSKGTGSVMSSSRASESGYREAQIRPNRHGEDGTTSEMGDK